jgi:hypothetical protein
VRQDRDYNLLRPRLCFVLFTLLISGAPLSVAQKTVVQDAGGGTKLEFDYNAAGQVTEQRTIGVDGKLLQKVDYEHRPEYYVADQTITFYWPDGKVRRITKNTYDATANFTGEFVQEFDQAGKQVGGHRLTHDPMTNVYTCKDWNTAGQMYKVIVCPASEESGGGEPKAAKKFTYDEVMQHLDAARKAGGEGELMRAATPAKKTSATVSPEVGLLVPAPVYAGERVSGTMVKNPAEYDGMAGVMVSRVAVTLESSGEASTLAGWTVEIPGENPQRADGPIVFTVPRDGAEVNLTFKQTGNAAHTVSTVIRLSQSVAKKQKGPGSFEAAALCVKGQLCTVQGPFSGDSSKTFAAFEDRPATVMAETADTAYIRIPDSTEPGSRPLFLAEGPKVVALPVVVGEFRLTNGDREVQQGQSLMTYPLLDGPSDITDEAWRPGNFPATNLEEARKVIPGFQLPHEDREAREKREAEAKGESRERREADEKKGGLILLVIKNMTPEQVSLRATAKDQMIVFHLNDDSFSRGEFKYDLLLDAIKPGHFDVRGYVIPFLAPVRGQEFPNKSSSAGE